MSICKVGNASEKWNEYIVLERYLAYEKPLCMLFPDLFKFCEQQNISLNQVRNNRQSVSFTRWLTDTLLIDWQLIIDDLEKINFTSEDDLVS